MKLLEYRGKLLLTKCGIRVPPSIITNNTSYINLSYHKNKYRNFFLENGKVIIKAQVITGKRKKLGLITQADDYADSLIKIDKIYKTKFQDKNINTLLIEKQLSIKEEYYLSIVYDTKKRMPMIMLSKEGGIEIESNTNKIATIHVSPSQGLYEFQARELAKKAHFTLKSDIFQIVAFIMRSYKCFTSFDCRILEINPIIKTKEGLLYAGDAKITIDDSGIARHDEFTEITDTEDESFLNDRERAARRIDYNDHRGVAGKTFMDLDGDIAILASGGGASLTSMDAIIEAGGKPANYVEYSGNPSKEKVKQLTELTLNKPGLKGCLVVGGKANFTDIFETLSGFMEAIVELKPKYPIVIRRAGPNDKKAFEMVNKLAKKYNLDITTYGEEMAMSKAAHIMVEKINGVKGT